MLWSSLFTILWINGFALQNNASTHQTCTHNIRYRNSCLHRKLREEDWHESFPQAHTVTNANSWREFQWEIMNRFFRTLQIVAKMNPKQSSTYWRGCRETKATYLHIFWQWPLLDNFLKPIFTTVNKVLDVKLIRDPLTAILEMKLHVNHCRKRQYLLQILLTVAKKAINKMAYKGSPIYAKWYTILRNICKMQKVTYRRTEGIFFIKRWTPLMEVMGQHWD